MKPIIESLLDTDLYKLTMMQCVFHHFRDAKALYRYQCRNHIQTRHLIHAIYEQIQSLKDISLSHEELDYLSSLALFKPDFLTYLKEFKLNPSQVHLDTHGDELTLEIEGPWVQTILFEVPLLAIISECYSDTLDKQILLKEGRKRVSDKVHFLAPLLDSGFGFTDFGTRRRFSKSWHREVLSCFKEQAKSCLHGTSNVMLAKELGLPVMGTMAHEYLQACQVLAPSLLTSQKYALDIWYQEYQGQLGIALTDSITMDVFLREFDKDLAHKYQGLRQDSGNPDEWTQKALAFYQAHQIPTKDKVFIYSDRLTLPKALKLYETYKGVVNPGFGIGTHITNDMGHETMDIVIKLNQLNEKPVVKISDSSGKAICDDLEYLNQFKKQFGLSED